MQRPINLDLLPNFSQTTLNFFRESWCAQALMNKFVQFRWEMILSDAKIQNN